VKPLDRRTVLRGAGGLALGLPFLNAMAPLRRATAAGEAAPQRVVVWFTPVGTVLGAWRPSGLGESYTTSRILAPLDTPTLRPRLSILSGIRSPSAEKLNGNGHAKGMSSMLTGRPFTEVKQTQFGDTGWGGGISIDQLLAQRLVQPGQLASIEAGILTRSGGTSRYMSYSGPGQANIVPAEPDPRKIFARAFSNNPGAGASLAELEAAAQQRRSVLDTVMLDFQRLSGKLGSEDQVRLDKHLALVRDLEQRIQVGGACNAPTAPAFNDDQVRSLDLLPELGRTQMDLVATALACDVTRVATLQWSGGESEFGFRDILPQAPWDQLSCPSSVDSCSDNQPNSAHHVMSHIAPATSGGIPSNMSEPQKVSLDCLIEMYIWYSQQLAYFAQKLADTPDVDGRSVLDNTIIVCATEIAEGPTHAYTDIPYLLIGGTGRIKPGHFNFDNQHSQNNLFVTVAQALGLSDVTQFGDPEFSTGTIGDLLV
jgi:hypothetical protein